MKITSRKQAALNDECTLIKNIYSPNPEDYDVPTSEDKKDVFCGIFSVNANEYYQAAKEGLRISWGIVINSVEDNDADQVQIGQSLYEVKRRYLRGDGYTELYLEEIQT